MKSRDYAQLASLTGESLHRAGLLATEHFIGPALAGPCNFDLFDGRHSFIFKTRPGFHSEQNIFSIKFIMTVRSVRQGQYDWLEPLHERHRDLRLAGSGAEPRCPEVLQHICHIIFERCRHNVELPLMNHDFLLRNADYSALEVFRWRKRSSIPLQRARDTAP